MKLRIDESKLSLRYRPPQNWGGYKPRRELPSYESLKVGVLDIETTSLDPQNGRIIMAGLGVRIEGQFSHQIFADDDERLLLRKLVAAINVANLDFLVGHNIFAFDLPFINGRAGALGLQTPTYYHYNNKGDGDVLEITIYSSEVNGKPITFAPLYWRDNHLPIVDTYQHAAIKAKSDRSIHSLNLKKLCLRLGLRAEQRLELSNDQIQRCYREGDLETIKRYLIYDLEDTSMLCDFLVPSKYYLLEHFEPSPNFDLQRLCYTGPASLWNRLLTNHYLEYYEQAFSAEDDEAGGGQASHCRISPKWRAQDEVFSIEPDERRDFGGGLVAVSPGLYSNCGKIDVKSMYPNIMLRYGITTEKDEHEFMLSVLKYLTEKRFEHKAEIKSLKRKPHQDAETQRLIAYHDQQQGATKILINGGYGFLGTNGVRFNDYKAAALVTAYGRKLLKLMCRTLSDIGAWLVEIDTDGIYYALPSDADINHQEVRQLVQSALPDGIEIESEYENSVIYAPKTKNYLIFLPNGKTEAKGTVFVSRNNNKLKNDFPIQYLKRYITDPTEADAYYQQLRDAIASREIDIAYLVERRKISANDKKLVKDGLGQAGDRVTFYWSHSQQHGKNGKKLLSYGKKDGKPKDEARHSVGVDSGIPYWIGYYLYRLDEKRDEILAVINQTRTINIEREVDRSG